MKDTDSKFFDNVLVSVIILNYNGARHLIECVESISNTAICKYEIILIDNNSSDNSHIACKEKFPEIILIQNKENIGMAARNMGLQKANGNFIVFLDSDTVVQNDWLVSLVKSYQKNGEGLYQPKLLEKTRPQIISSGGNMINIFGLANILHRGEQDVGQCDDFLHVSYTSGACTFSSSETMKKIGPVDDIFFAYHDDVDYGWRALLLGIRSYYEPTSVVYHYGSQTLEWSSKKFFLLERNRIICLLTLYSRNTYLKIFPLLILVEIGVFFFCVGKGFAITKLRSYFALIKIRKKIHEKRIRVEQTKIISDKAVIKNFVDDFYLPLITKKYSAKIFNSIISVLSKQARKIISL